MYKDQEERSVCVVEQRTTSLQTLNPTSQRSHFGSSWFRLQDEKIFFATGCGVQYPELRHRNRIHNAVGCSLRSCVKGQPTKHRGIMAISVHVHLLSGKSASLEVEVDASVQSLKNRAQSALMVPGRGRLLKPLERCLTEHKLSNKPSWRAEMCSTYK